LQLRRLRAYLKEPVKNKASRKWFRREAVNLIDRKQPKQCEIRPISNPVIKLEDLRRIGRTKDV
jgi:hypothetical protein